jgi:ABC-type Fe3+-siderophore transport system permease subunit
VAALLLARRLDVLALGDEPAVVLGVPAAAAVDGDGARRR